MMRPLLVLSLLLAGSMASAETVLVKSRDTFYWESSLQHHIPVGRNCWVSSFTPASPAPVISPASNDPRTVTGSSSFLQGLSGCNFGDADSDGYAETYLDVVTYSLLDLGRRNVECEVTFVASQYCWADPNQICGVTCLNTAPRSTVRHATTTIFTVNSAPVATPPSPRPRRRGTRWWGCAPMLRTPTPAPSRTAGACRSGLRTRPLS
ncbi:hypothetical protein HPC49_16820 [Pyxidicoccus fallax]|uniref:Lipoprotein n=1 Tax=Pyxidicoccus fallax TaxID=394095 RepID=A0A848LDN1_9BACT|nr:hypothetical protein [Pyxidicoccus fallax]NMO16556.1 hypothetical protein [Pyxidicoccus fallax]NPC79880.1 hypothetical protein [Pyxidicoccus fallax]